MPHRVVWFDVPALDLQRAIKFYAAVLACKVSQDFGDMKVGVIEHEGSDVSGCIVAHEGEQPSASGPLLYFSVSGRLDEAVTAAQLNGGKVLKAKHQIGPYGYRAIVLDSEGNRIALHSE